MAYAQGVVPLPTQTILQPLALAQFGLSKHEDQRFELGYVGTVSAACLSADGHHHGIGVDTGTTKIDLINAGTGPIVEKDIAPLLSEAAAIGRLRATTDHASAGDLIPQ